MPVVKQLLGNVDMHKYAKFDRNIPYFTRISSISQSNQGRMDDGTDRLTP